MYRKILVGLDGSKGSWEALSTALALAQREAECEVWAVSVEERLPHMPEVVDELTEEKERLNAIYESIQREAGELADRAGVPLKSKTLIGHAAQSVAQFAEEGGFDLVVIGHSGQSGVWGRFLGSTADKIVRHAPCDVLVVR